MGFVRVGGVACVNDTNPFARSPQGEDPIAHHNLVDERKLCMNAVGPLADDDACCGIHGP